MNAKTKKYELVESSKTGFYRIKALRDLPEVGIREGDLGGFLEGEHNLSQEGNCWVYDLGTVWGQAFVCEDAKVRDATVGEHAILRGQAAVAMKAEISGNAQVGDGAYVTDSLITDHARVLGYSIVDHSCISGDAVVEGDVCYGKVYDHAQVMDDARVQGDGIESYVVIAGHARIMGQGSVKNGAHVRDHAVVSGRAVVADQAILHGFACLTDDAAMHANSVALDKAYIYGRARLGRNSIAKGSACVNRHALEGTFHRPFVYDDPMAWLEKYIEVTSTRSVTDVAKVRSLLGYLSLAHVYSVAFSDDSVVFHVIPAYVSDLLLTLRIPESRANLLTYEGESDTCYVQVGLREFEFLALQEF